MTDSHASDVDFARRLVAHDEFVPLTGMVTDGGDVVVSAFGALAWVCRVRDGYRVECVDKSALRLDTSCAATLGCLLELARDAVGSTDWAPMCLGPDYWVVTVWSGARGEKYTSEFATIAAVIMGEGRT